MVAGWAGLCPQILRRRPEKSLVTARVPRATPTAAVRRRAIPTFQKNHVLSIESRLVRCSIFPINSSENRFGQRRKVAPSVSNG